MTNSVNIAKKLEERLHANDLSEIAHQAEGNADGTIDTLLHFACDETADPATKKIADNATWAIQHLLPKDFSQFVLPHKARLMQLAISTQSETKQRMLLSILRETTFEKDDLQTDFLDFCLSTIASAQHHVGTRALCIHLSYMQCRHYPELLKELKQQLELMDDGLLQPGLRSAKANTLKLILKK